ncbi:MAG TPA: lipopolysaccharide assembly protein LapA domain-containing protein [Acidimicrobiales bacterium]|nr:lipopolysaccharide assembly protein LapA domain-containing protein [Acidimicrobiales bacterium]
MAKRTVHTDAVEPDDGGKAADRRRSMMLVAVAVATILLVWFAVANLKKVKIDFWLYDREAPLILVILISGLLGALITALVMRRKPRE